MFVLFYSVLTQCVFSCVPYYASVYVILFGANTMYVLFTVMCFRPDNWIAHIFQRTPLISPHLLGFFIYEDFAFREAITDFGDAVSKGFSLSGK